MGVHSSREKDESRGHVHRWKNLQFYRNEIKSSQYWDGYKIEEMLGWWGKYNKLETKHDYIQWLFPIPDTKGVNSSAQPLYEEEAKAIREDESCRARVREAYSMMLDFYGMKLYDENYGHVRRRQQYEERYENFKRYTHNNRRITRILISIGELGFERFQVPWVNFLLEEIFVNNLLPKGGFVMHWIGAIKDIKEREQMYQNYENLCSGDRPKSYTPSIVTESSNDGKNSKTVLNTGSMNPHNDFSSRDDTDTLGVTENENRVEQPSVYANDSSVEENSGINTNVNGLSRSSIHNADPCAIKCVQSHDAAGNKESIVQYDNGKRIDLPMKLVSKNKVELNECENVRPSTSPVENVWIEGGECSETNNAGNNTFISHEVGFSGPPFESIGMYITRV